MVEFKKIYRVHERRIIIYIPYDLPTIAFFSLIFHGLFAIVFLVLWLHNRSYVKGLGFWTANLFLHTAGRLFATESLFFTSPVFSTLSNVCTLVGATLFLFGLGVFTKTKIRYRFYYFFIVVTAIIMVLMTFLTKNQLYRSLFNGGAIVFLSIQYLCILWKKRNMNPYLSKPLKLLIALYALFILLFIGRAVVDVHALIKGIYLEVFDSPAIRLSRLFSLISLTAVNFTTLILSNNTLIHDLAQKDAVKTKLLSKLKNQSEHDSLTSVLNRNGLEHVLDTMGALEDDDGNHCLFFLVDIDDFKHINDTYGHAVGDIVLVQMAKLFTQSIRPTDHVTRWGGDEFFIMVKDSHANTVAQRLLSVVRLANWKSALGNDKDTITISIGYTAYRPTDTKDEIFKRCDDYLYMAKHQGKNRANGDS